MVVNSVSVVVIVLVGGRVLVAVVTGVARVVVLVTVDSGRVVVQGAAGTVTVVDLVVPISVTVVVVSWKPSKEEQNADARRARRTASHAPTWSRV